MRIVRNALLGSLLMVIGTGAVAQAQGWAAGHAQATKTISIGETNGKYLFKLATATVKVGTRVIWSNNSDAAHTATSNKTGVFDLSIPAKKSRSVVLKKAGTYKYSCSIHSYMKAKIVVTK